MHKEICSAIESRKIIVFNYDGGSRRVEPYCYGISRNGKELLRAYQISGFSRSRNPSGWKLFHVSKIKGVQIINEAFIHNRRDYNPRDSAMERIYCKV